jgi:hypothetical protein
LKLYEDPEKLSELSKLLQSMNSKSFLETPIEGELNLL